MRIWRLVVVLVAVVFAAGACGCAPEPAPPQPSAPKPAPAPSPPAKAPPRVPTLPAGPTTPPSTNACGVAEAPTAPLTAEEAEEAAVEAVAQAEDDPELLDDDGRVPLVILEDTVDEDGIVAVSVDDADEARAVARDATETGNVVAIEVDQPVYALESFPPNDPLFGQQWGLQAHRTSFGAAWETATGAGVTVAVLDTGVQANHPDLVGKVTAGPSYVGGSSGADGHGHGTHVAGIIGARTNNAIGVAGAAPGVEILSIKVLDDEGKGTTLTVANGIHAAVNVGVDVINLSLGADSPSGVLAHAVSRAWAQNIPMVAAAGNDGAKTTPGYAPGVHCAWPAGYSTTITVASLDSNLQRSSFSNRGTFLDVAAPGRSVRSTDRASTYSAKSGTSMAAPFVAAAIALLVEDCGPRSSQWYRQAIRASATNYPSKNIDVGYGRVDPKRALDQAGC